MKRAGSEKVAGESSEYAYGSEALYARVSRVVSLVPSVTESLFDIDLGERVVGVTDYCTRPADRVARLPHVGGTKTPDIDHILALRPELVFASREENRKQDVERLQAAGIPVWVTHPQTVQDVFNLLWDIMNAFETTVMVPRVRLIEYTYDWVRNSEKNREGTSCRVFVPIWNDPLMTVSDQTYTHDLLEVCGGQNVFADRRDSRYPQVTLEAVEAAQPDLILLPDEPYTFTEAERGQFAALDIPAARSGRIIFADGSLLTWPGTRVAYALNDLPRLLYPMDEERGTRN